jgi:hypothetical protein
MAFALSRGVKLYSQVHATEDIINLLKHLGVARAHIVGLSTGGNAALQRCPAPPRGCALRHDSRVSATAQKPTSAPSSRRIKQRFEISLVDSGRRRPRDARSLSESTLTNSASEDR